MLHPKRSRERRHSLVAPHPSSLLTPRPQWPDWRLPTAGQVSAHGHICSRLTRASPARTPGCRQPRSAVTRAPPVPRTTWSTMDALPGPWGQQAKVREPLTCAHLPLRGLPLSPSPVPRTGRGRARQRHQDTGTAPHGRLCGSRGALLQARSHSSSPPARLTLTRAPEQLLCTCHRPAARPAVRQARPDGRPLAVTVTEAPWLGGRENRPRTTPELRGFQALCTPPQAPADPGQRTHRLEPGTSGYLAPEPPSAFPPPASCLPVDPWPWWDPCVHTCTRVEAACALLLGRI